MAGPNEMQQYGGRIQKGRKTGEISWPLHGQFHCQNTCTDNYGALYCKVRTLRQDFAWEAVIAVDRTPTRNSMDRFNRFQHHSLDVVSVPVASSGGRMSECVSAFCLSRFSPQSPLYDFCVVFFVHVLPRFKFRGA